MWSRSRVVLCVCSGGAGEAGDVNGCEVDDCVLRVHQVISGFTNELVCRRASSCWLLNNNP